MNPGRFGYELCFTTTYCVVQGQTVEQLLDQLRKQESTPSAVSRRTSGFLTLLKSRIRAD